MSLGVVERLGRDKVLRYQDEFLTPLRRAEKIQGGVAANDYLVDSHPYPEIALTLFHTENSHVGVYLFRVLMLRAGRQALSRLIQRGVGYLDDNTVH